MIYAEELYFCLGFLKICLPVKSRKLAIEDSCNCPAEPAVSLYSLFSATVLGSLVSDVIPLSGERSFGALIVWLIPGVVCYEKNTLEKIFYGI